MNIKDEFLKTLIASELLIRDTYRTRDNKIIYIKGSKIFEDHYNYWFTINEENIKNFQKYGVTNIIFIGPVGYYDIPINVIDTYIKNFKVIPNDGKYHLHIYLKDHMLSQNSSNQINVSEYHRELPFELVEPVEVVEREEIKAVKMDDLTNKRKYFSTNTNITSIDLSAPTGTEEFVFEGIYTLRNQIKTGSIIFFTQHGDRPPWPPGLSAICEVTKEPYQIGYDKAKPTYYRIKMKPLIILPEVLNRSDFMGYFNCYDVTFIGPTTKGEPNQAISSMTPDKARHVVGAIIDTFPELKGQIETIFGVNFPIITKKAVIPNEVNINSISDVKNDKPSVDVPNKIDDSEPRNLIVYGAPGTGKSYKLKMKVEGNGNGISGLFPDEWLRTRITFHPNYSYRNFVGSYKPMPLYKDSKKKIYSSDTVTENKQHQKEPFIEYQFEPGPFLEMFIRAIQNPNYNFVIIIEEINRANTAGVFGDVFQLLDRNESGESEYSITLEPSAQDYLKANNIVTSSIKIPSNLYLWATMNSADQGVMPLDSAFKRRWSFEHLGLNENKADVNDLYIKMPFLTKNGEKLKWNEFRRIVNLKLLSDGIHEDKLIGPFFLNKSEINNPKSVKNKLLLYLKEDVLRYKSGLFNEDLRSFSEISEAFENEENIFSKDLVFKTDAINTDESETEETETEEAETIG
ncbi:AAA family ATPase [Flavobacterium yafengii]|uniref:AAA family ATPase n=1 Tax=Flavobacterium yafengii TaxID=3041253 RepID=UPI0024A7F82F|nr:AAA family ATPase [Flavobacterium yafengii]MDI6047042.1 AAA family ATPase [Flavobacterium yafengii]